MTRLNWLARFSLSSRLMAYSVVFTYVLLAVFWTIFFILAKEGLIKQDQDFLDDRIKTISSLLVQEGGASDRLARRINIEWFQRDFENVYARVLDPQGKVVAITPSAAMQNLQIKEHLEQAAETAKTRSRFQRIETESNIYEVAVTKVNVPNGTTPGEYTVEIALNRTSEQTLLSNFRKFFVVLLFIGGAASLWLGRIMVRIALRPIRDVTAMAARVNSERLNERIEPATLPIEFREVAETMNAMLDRLGEYFERLTRFSQDMAHELRTPVNNLRGSMEVGLSRERTPEEYKNLLGSGLEECERLKRIIDSLMFIARTSDPGHKLVKQALEADSELADIVSFYQLSAEEKNIQLKVEGPKNRILYAERTHLQRCIGNLLSNSIRHNPQNSEIILRVEETSEWLIIRVSDSGSGIPKASLQRIGERFFRTDESRSKIYGGTGLGLSIAKSIVEMHGGKMTVMSEENVGTTISLFFPVKSS